MFHRSYLGSMKLDEVVVRLQLHKPLQQLVAAALALQLVDDYVVFQTQVRQDC